MSTLLVFAVIDAAWLIVEAPTSSLKTCRNMHDVCLLLDITSAPAAAAKSATDCSVEMPLVVCSCDGQNFLMCCAASLQSSMLLGKLLVCLSVQMQLISTGLGRSVGLYCFVLHLSLC